MKTKIYEIQVNAEKEWVCADTAIEALKFYESITDCSLTEFENDDDIVEVPKEDWKFHNIVDTEAARNDDGEYPIIQSFEEYMKTASKCDIIATTNC